MRISTLLESAAIAALLATSATGAMAQTINGGGSSLAGNTYIAEFSLYNTNNPGAPISFSYFTIGSGAAQSAFIGQTPTTFGLPSTSTVHFAASDASLSSTQITTWNGGTVGAKGGSMIELPTFGTPITVPFHSVDNGSGGTISSLTLTEAQVCGIFSSRLTHVSDVVPGYTGTATLQVTYRTDNSGTTFLLTQHLTQVCGTPSTNGLRTGVTEPVTFFATQTFANLFLLNSSTLSGAPHAVPSNFIGGNTSSNTTPGSLGVYQQVMANTDVVGYLSPDFTQIASVHSGDSAFPLTASVINARNSVTYTPSFDNAATALGTSGQGGVPVVNSRVAGDVGVPVVADPLSGYPIVGYTTWDVAQCYSDTNVAANLRTFLNAHYNDALDSAINANGFTAVSGAIFNNATDAVATISVGSTGTGTACHGHTGL